MQGLFSNPLWKSKVPGNKPFIAPFKGWLLLSSFFFQGPSSAHLPSAVLLSQYVSQARKWVCLVQKWVSQVPVPPWPGAAHQAACNTLLLQLKLSFDAAASKHWMQLQKICGIPQHVLL